VIRASLVVNVPVYLVLLHDPVTNRNGKRITTAVTNLDLHDIARSCRTYGLAGYFVVTPIPVQQELVARILGHWRSQQSAEYHPDRAEALSLVEVAPSFSEVRERIKDRHGQNPEVVLTDARPQTRSVSYGAYREELSARAVETTEGTPASAQGPRPVCLVFGTGWGVSEDFHPEVDRILEPIHGRKDLRGRDYNHLSVRAAAAIILDRLLGT